METVKKWRREQHRMKVEIKEKNKIINKEAPFLQVPRSWFHYSGGPRAGIDANKRKKRKGDEQGNEGIDALRLIQSSSCAPKGFPLFCPAPHFRPHSTLTQWQIATIGKSVDYVPWQTTTTVTVKSIQSLRLRGLVGGSSRDLRPKSHRRDLNLKIC